MNKIMEYMYFGLPIVAFDLRETRFSAQEAALYAPANSRPRWPRRSPSCSMTSRAGG